MTQYTLYGWTRYQCTLEPWIPELESVLTVTRPGFTESADRQIRFVDEERRFYESIPQSIPKFSWGFADIIVDWIAARGDAIKIYPPKGISLGQENLRGNSRLRDARNDEAFDQLTDRVQDFVGMAHKTWMMRLIEPSINKVLHMIAGYALAYPHARIAIGVPNKAEVRMVISGLNRCMQRNPGTRWCRSDPSHHYTRYPQRVVATMGHLPSASLDEYDMLVILDLSHCVGDFTSFNDLVLGRKRLVEPRQLGAITSRAQQGWRRVIVVLPQQPQKGSYDDMMAAHVAGTVEWSEQSSLPRTHVHVEWLQSRGTQAKKGLDALTQKRDLYWANTRRNRRIAEIARRVAARTKNGLKAFGLSDDAVDRICHAARSGIVIHVESPEHGRELQKILDWPLYHMTTDPNSYEEPFIL